MSAPRFSIVVPTRNRPDFVRYCLDGIAAQTFGDFEVIVADNHTGTPARSRVEDMRDERFVCVTPPEPLAMAENWEFACQHARGEYVAVVIDKTVLYPSALELAERALQADPVDIVTWWNEIYLPIDEATSLGPGSHRPAFSPAEPTRYDPLEEIASKFAMPVRRGTDGVHYFRNKICFGLFSSDLLARMRSAVGRWFFPLAPDYTSMVTAAATAASAVDLGRPLLMSFSSARSNGRRQTYDPAYARQFLLDSDPSGRILASLPIDGCYASLHNVVAYDLVASAERVGAARLPGLDLVNLATRAREDLEAVHWTDAAEREQQYACLEAFEREVGVVGRGGIGAPSVSRPKALAVAALARVPRLERVLLQLRGRPTSDRYESIIDAVRHNDARYGGSGGLAPDKQDA